MLNITYHQGTAIKTMRYAIKTAQLLERPKFRTLRYQVLRDFGTTGTLIHCCWKCKTVWPLWKPVWCFFVLLFFLIKPNKLLTYDLAIVFLGIYSNELKAYIYTNLHMNIYWSLAYNYQNLQATILCQQ